MFYCLTVYTHLLSRKMFLEAVFKTVFRQILARVDDLDKIRPVLPFILIGVAGLGCGERAQRMQKKLRLKCNLMTYV